LAQLAVSAAAAVSVLVTVGFTATGGFAGLVAFVALFGLREYWRASRLAKRDQDPTLQNRIASFYDQTSQVWEEVWGEHMHHGYYKKGEVIRNHEQNIEAQEDMVEAILKYGNVDKMSGPIRILDAGCGIGGSARYLAEKFPEAKVNGITLSPFQRQRAVALTKAKGLEDRVNFDVEDAMHTRFPDNTFDLVYSMESGEHMPDKKGFVEECKRVLKPGGTLVMAVWCHRETPPALEPQEVDLLQKIYKVYALPYVCQLSDFQKFAVDMNMTNTKFEDWTDYIKPFWWEVIKKAVSVQGVVGLIRSGWTAIYGAWAAWWMHKAVEGGVFVFGAFTATKKAEA
jgi:tocopherol O-methyltransferase